MLSPESLRADYRLGDSRWHVSQNAGNATGDPNKDRENPLTASPKGAGAESKVAIEYLTMREPGRGLF